MRAFLIDSSAGDRMRRAHIDAGCLGAPLRTQMHVHAYPSLLKKSKPLKNLSTWKVPCANG